MICRKCGSIFTPPFLCNPNSHQYNYCHECHADYLNVLMKCADVHSRVTADEVLEAQKKQNNLVNFLLSNQ